MCDAHGFVTAVGKIYPAHCRTPAISEDDLTIGAAAELIETMKGTIPVTATKKLRHTKTLKKLVTILENREPPRVANGGQPRVSPAASTSSNPTSPRVIAKTKFVHQRRTRNNIPLPIIQEEEDVREATPPQQVQQNDGGTEDDPIPHYVKDVQEMLRSKSRVNPVEPMTNVVQQNKKGGKTRAGRTHRKYTQQCEKSI